MPNSQNPNPISTVHGEPTSKYEAEIDQWRHLVWYVVNRIKARLPVSVSEDELYAAGMYGLMRAARSYDPTKGAGFKTYAYHRIRGSILDDLRRLDFLPRSMRDRARQNGEAAPSLVGIPTDEDGHESLAAEQASAESEGSDMHDVLHREIDALPDKMRIVMSMYYREEMNMREIGEKLNLTESRVSQIHSNAVSRLRRVMRSAGGEI
ncbi:MAG: sigma-70 family RNA polymerase sigma factor [Planctomycetota bacterium]|nr:sigma-70 family RNA polymerase sigma factor [Planctomycetota bacterium]MDA1113491.1 sigma-70 family RNA polymerase sigma factor [Planctomycetota bacterium]